MSVEECTKLAKKSLNIPEHIEFGKLDDVVTPVLDKEGLSDNPLDGNWIS